MKKPEIDWFATASVILEQAAFIISEKFRRGEQLYNTQVAKEYLLCKLAGHDREVFSVMLLDNQNRLIDEKELFYGTIDSASVYPRAVK